MAENSKLDLGRELGKKFACGLRRMAGRSSARLGCEIDRRLAGNLVGCQKGLQSFDLIEVVLVLLLKDIKSVRGKGGGGIRAFHHADLFTDSS
jgi:hypothetical protein